jgi:hypothetical protein
MLNVRRRESRSTMPSAQLIHRGEEFQFVDDAGNRYVGTCLWSRENAPGKTPKRAGPVYIYARSIRRTGIAWLLPLGGAKKLAIARLARALPSSPESNLPFLVAEDMPRVVTQQ